MSAMYEQPVDLTLLSAYLDGEVTPEERALVEGQLRLSPAWREELESLRWTVNLLRELPELPLPRSFELPVPAETARAAPSGATRARGWRLDLGWMYAFFRTSAAVTVALLLAVVGLDMWQTRGDLARDMVMTQAPASAPAPDARLSQPAQGLQPEAPQAAQPAARTTAPAGKALQNPQAQGTFPAAAAAPRPGSGGAGGGGGVPGGGAGGLGGGDGTGAGGVGSSTEGGLPLVATPAASAGGVGSSTTPDTQSALAPKVQPQAQAVPPPQAAQPPAEAAPQPLTDATSDRSSADAPSRPWRWLEVVLAGLVVTLVAGAWAVRRRLKTDE